MAEDQPEMVPLLPWLAQDSHSPDRGGTKGGRGAGGDIRVVLGIKFVFNSVLESKETDSGLLPFV